MPRRTQKIRIIAGKWKGRKLDFPIDGRARPTSGRLKETLFNWLAGHIEGAHCLDLFAGSGALGLEALSRGAVRCVFVENSFRTASVLRDSIRQLEAEDSAEVLLANALSLVSAGELGDYDLIFVDPPFHAQMLARLYPHLPSLMRPGGMLYIESAQNSSSLAPKPFELLKQTRVGDVRGQVFILPSDGKVRENTDDEKATRVTRVQARE